VNLILKVTDPEESSFLGSEKGFKSVRIDAVLNDTVVGSIKIVLLSKENFQRTTKSAWHYLKIWKNYSRIDIDAFEAGNHEDLYNSLCGYPQMPPSESEALPSREKREALLKIEMQTLLLIEEELGAFIDSPYIEQIKILDEDRRLAITSTLYSKATEYMTSFGYRFKASHAQTEVAKSTWDRLVEKGLAIRYQDGCYQLI
jgi:hypothetical protein